MKKTTYILKHRICLLLFILLYSVNVISQVNRAISTTNDDAEERISSGNMDLGSSDLELCTESGDQYVGLRFQNVIIPQGANITNAYIQFMVDETNSTSVNLNITGIDVDNASTFTSAGYNISQRIDGTISSNTTASVAWTPANWPTVGAQGADQQTPDISTIVKEIVDRGGWNSGNAMSFVFSKISGSGKRVAESYDGTNNPTLYVTYNTTPEITFFDSDGDGVLDNIDIDDDNDGIVDSEEENSCKNSAISVATNYKFLNETFGTGNRTTINTTYDATTSYCYEDAAGGGCTGGIDLNDGEYVVYYKAADGDGTNDTPVGEVASWADAYWYTGEDHTTGDTNGRMAMFNASYDPGTFYTANITGALPNVPITYSFWVLNLDTTLAPGIATRLRPNILVEFRDTSNNLLASITTGDIPPSINGDPANSWHLFTANLTFAVDEFNVYFINNETGGSGNDLAIDDIVISQTLCDTDSDGVADIFDLDADNDGIPDVVEAGLGAFSEGTATLTGVASWIDTNGNGMHDLVEGNITLDTDGDGTPNFLDLDSDNDTIFDVDESGAGNTADALYQNGDGDINGDGVGDGTDSDSVRETDVDSDGTLEYFTDGVLDIYDYYNGITLPTAYGNTNQGLGNTYYVLDTDSDGSPDYMDVTSDGSTYDISYTLYASLDANNDGIIDDTNDTDGDGIVDLFDTDDAAFGSPRDLNTKLDLYFDGRNDYAEDINVINAWGEATIMTWIKIDPSATGTQIIAGQDEFYLQLNADKSVSAIANGYTVSNGAALNTNQWIYMAASYSNSNSILRLYINGFETSNIGVSGALPADTSNFTIGREPNTNDKYYHGYIDELRVFDKALSSDELRKMIYQEIENNGGIARGSIIPKNITDFIDETNNDPLNWANVIRYFRMDAYKDDIIDDLTTATVDVGSGAKIYNTKRISTQTAPLPFITQTTGNLDAAVDVPADGVNGTDVTTYDWSIVQIEHDNIVYNSSYKHLGLFVNELDAGSNPIELSIQNDSELNVSWYLKLDGLIDLEGESQLVQGPDSTLDITSKGAIERDQQGTADLYTYNYWAAPVGVTSVVSNNNNYSLADILNDGTTPATPLTINWITSGYDGTSGSPVGIADYWIWKYADQVSDDYPSWQHVRSTGALQPGEGYTMKGTTDTGGAISTQQNYVFNGKPHNGDVTLTLSALNDYLIGNPYASAIDANEFILDNINDGAGRAASNIINGTLYFWEHFASSTHNLAEYQGGYGSYTLLGGVVAISNDVRINNTGASGTKMPEQYIPVGQGFFVTAGTGGTITFKNSQRTFKTEASDPSTFMRAAENKKSKSNNTTSATRTNSEDTRQKIRLMFDSPKGYHRQLLVGVDSSATDNHDMGYDAPLIEDNLEDMYWIIDSNKFVIQGVGDFNSNRTLALGVKINQEGNATIRIDYLENIPVDTNIYLHDKALNVYHNLKDSNYETYLTVGEHMDRFEITFASNEVEEDNNGNAYMNLDAHYSNNINSVIIVNPKEQTISNIKMINILGQVVFESTDIISDTYKEIKVKYLDEGVYLINIMTVKGKLTKKVIIE